MRPQEPPGLGAECGFEQPDAGPLEPGGKSEQELQQRIRPELGTAPVRLWRNNVGALREEGGRLVTYGLPLATSWRLRRERAVHPLAGTTTLLQLGRLSGHSGPFWRRQHARIDPGPGDARVGR